ncbi:MAG: NAD(P)H-hydrate dehydratase [Trueperaceae bacterium]|nr:NAD(P)H-hydrate dehydratase [Trueperaceae bacterium]
MKLYSAQNMQEADKAVISSGIPSQLLMEIAGQKVADYALEHWQAAKSFLILCGKGNNGGDGYVAARYLTLRDKKVTVLELSSEPATEDAKVARAAFQAVGECFAMERLEAALPDAHLIIDGLFGSGLNRPLEADLKNIVTALNDSGKEILSIDIPSGLSADKVVPIGPHVNARRTLQLAGPKLASVFYPARAAFGLWDVADIGIPQSILQDKSNINLLNDEFAARNAPHRDALAHKYSVGTVLVIAGSSRYLGAAEMACRAAYRGGAGLVTLAAESRLPGSWPEIIFEPLNWLEEPLKAISTIAENRAQTRVIGPGLDSVAEPFLADLIRQSKAPTVLDAGALAPSREWFRAVKEQGNCVITPHAGEAAKLLDTRSEAVLHNPLESARQLTEVTGATTVLKGATSVITHGDEVWVSTRGHPGMATGGTGDVLAGLIGSFVTGGELAKRVAVAVYIHGRAGEAAAQLYGNGLVATDLLEQIPQMLKSCLRHENTAG